MKETKAKKKTGNKRNNFNRFSSNNHCVTNISRNQHYDVNRAKWNFK